MHFNRILVNVCNIVFIVFIDMFSFISIGAAFNVEFNQQGICHFFAHIFQKPNFMEELNLQLFFDFLIYVASNMPLFKFNSYFL